MARNKKPLIYIIAGTFYKDISLRQIKNAHSVLLEELKIPQNRIKILETEGSLELPYLINAVCKKHKPDGILALGCIIKGQTNHFELISTSVTNNLIQISLRYNIPITSGVLTVTNKKQIRSRTSGGSKDRAIEAARSLVKLIRISGSL
tara:strand:- start:131 stop:577 length:447 start_codon:yes stop_codon:yes gene_type:complete